MAERWFLKIDGVPGDSTVAAHKDEIDIESWSWGVSNAGSASGPGGGGGAGRPTFTDFQFVARISKASPKLFLSCATGTHHKDARLSGVRSGRAKDKYLEIDLTDVVISSYQQADGPETVPTDQFSLNFAKVEISYFPQDKTGTLGPPVTAGYDVKASKKV